MVAHRRIHSVHLRHLKNGATRFYKNGTRWLIVVYVMWVVSGVIVYILNLFLPLNKQVEIYETPLSVAWNMFFEANSIHPSVTIITKIACLVLFLFSFPPIFPSITILSSESPLSMCPIHFLCFSLIVSIRDLSRSTIVSTEILIFALCLLR